MKFFFGSFCAVDLAAFWARSLSPGLYRRLTKFGACLILGFLWWMPCWAQENSSPAEIQERLLGHGIQAKVVTETHRSIVSFNSQDVEACTRPICRLLKRASGVLGLTTIQLASVDSLGRAIPWGGLHQKIAGRHVITLNSDKHLGKILDDGELIFRHELQHALLTENGRNHTMNASVQLSRNLPGYWWYFSLQELFTYVDQNRRAQIKNQPWVMSTWDHLPLGLVNGLFSALKSFALSVQDKTYVFEDHRDLKVDSPQAEKLLDQAGRGFVDSVKVFQLSLDPTGENAERFQFVFVRGEESVTFNSDYEFRLVEDQFLSVFKNISSAFSIFYRSLMQTHPGARPVTPADYGRLAELFKGKGNLHLFRVRCESVF